ncbi:hypothetical protein V5O48_001180 [Marasmius crinis-equi]|uniref:RRM domain-containing protein n=1 Tax=Marasmius crinis-equi TaxID=585013 RepID=A0ABR3FZI9_9AGAR
MPNKFFPRPRQWGTRFDSLPSSPPPSPPESEDSLGQDSVVDVRDDELDASIIERKHEHEKMPHDASVFVGSLPPHIDNNELARLLTEHLAEYGEVKCIKVIRDTKGSACAFVQCQDAASAARLIHTLHFHPPKPFLGRQLRYEQARAFRTLLISYCIPTHHIMSMEHKIADGSIPGNTIELDLPSAMRICRSQTIHYNNAAVEVDCKVRDGRGPTAEEDLHLEPLMFDEKTLQAICAHFGPFETFVRLPPPAVEGALEHALNWTSYPPPHNAPRKPNMDKGVFKVKWEHRDDCVSALTTLRKVPHLKVTWAHTAPSHAIEPAFQPGSFFQHRPQARYTPSRGERAPLSRDPIIVESSLSEWNAGPVHLPQQDSVTTLVAHADMPSWSDPDFSPLNDPKEERIANMCGEWHPKKTLEGQEPESIDTVAEMFSEIRVTSTTLPDHLSGECELEIPLAPALTMSPTTPKSPLLLTPIGIEGFKSVSVRKEFTAEADRVHLGDRLLDTTTLFVGGLETHGPEAWDETKVRNYFEKFGGLQDVRLIQPANGKAAFAFVQFDNLESPARAIQQEHNWMYQGRPMRVQYRQYNLPRGGSMRGRGRGRSVPIQTYRHPRQGMQPQHVQADASADITLSDMSISTADRTRTEDVTSIPAEAKNVLTETAGPDVLGSSLSQANNFVEKPQGVDFPNITRPNSQSSIEAISQPDRFREWYEINVPQQEPHSTEPTPPSSTPLSGSENVASGAQYPVPPPTGYYSPPSWVQSYPSQVQYPVPYVPGYPFYPVPNSTQPSYPSTPSSDSNGPTSTAPGQWPMYGPYIPYPAPYPPRPPHTAEQPVPPQTQGQPPVVPSGFIQGEQGTLIAVYRQDALDQYLHQATGVNPPPSSQSSAHRVWPHYPPPPYPAAASGQAPLRINTVPGYGQPPKPGLLNAPRWPAGGARLPGPPSAGFHNGSGTLPFHDNEGHGSMAKRGRRDGTFHQRNAYSRQAHHRHGRGAAFVHQNEFASNAANVNAGHLNSWPAGRRDPLKPYHLS